MLNELIDNYEKYSDSELMEINLNKDKYTDEARKALAIVIEKKGGIESLNDRFNKLKSHSNETARIHHEVIKLFEKEIAKIKINQYLNSEILKNSEIQTIIDKIDLEIKAEKTDLEIRPRTIIGSIIGTIAGGTFGGILWGLQMIYSGHIFYIFGIGVILNSYAFIKLFTKQSKSNFVVLAFTILSSLFAFILGSYLYDFFGYYGPKKFE